MAVMSSAATFSVEKKHLTHVILGSSAIAVIFFIFYFLFEQTRKAKISAPLSEQQTHRYHITAMIVVISLILAEIISYFLSAHFQFSHLYWIGLAALVVIQSSQRKTIQTSFKRILVNTAGALMTVGLFGYLIPPAFWINLAVLILFLFLIFFLGFSYTGRTLFIELFVLGFTHLLGSYHNLLAYDRVILTLIGGAIVIISTIKKSNYSDSLKSKNIFFLL